MKRLTRMPCFFKRAMSRASEGLARATSSPPSVVTSARFADALKGGIRGSELTVFEACAHAPIYEDIAAFNERTLAFLARHAG